MSNSAKKKQLPAFLVLTIISLVAAIALAVTNEITRGPIAENAAKARREAFGVVLAAESYADVEGVALPEGVSSLVEARSGDELLGYCVVASAQGYAGPVAVTLGVDPNGVVTGAKIGDTNFSETAGFGMRWKEETERAEQFKGISLKDGGMIEAITGATMTSNAVLKASNNALATVSTVLGIERTEPVLAFGKKEVAYADSVAAGEYSVSKRGFASEVKVTFTVDENSTITAITIDSTGETSGFGTRCTEDESFRAQFIGQKVPLALGEGVDVLSGATITSTAIVDAINSIAASGDEPAAETSAKAVTEAAEGTLSATGVGFVNEDVTVIVTLNEDGTIATLAFDLSEQMEPVCNLVDTDEFKVQFIGKKGPFEGVDIVSGATFTSNGIIEALNKLFPAEETAPAAEAAVLTAKGVGFVNEDVTVIVTLNEDGTIATLAFDLSEQMEPVCNLVDTDEFKAQFIGKKGPFEGVDIVAGATYTSNGIIEALNKLFPAEEAAPAAEAAVLTATGVGFVNEDVTVIVTLNEDGTIATLAFDLSDQMEPVCNLVDTDEFKAQFIGKKGPFEGVDVVAGATYTSNGIIEALNKLFPAEEAAPAAEAAVLTATGVGFVNEDVTVTVTLNEDGTIATLAFDLSDQMEPVCNLVDTDEFKAQFIGKKGPFEGVDIVAGATYTSNGIIEALNKLFPAEETAPAAEAAVLTATGVGFVNEDVTVTVTLNEDGTIATLAFDLSDQMEPVCNLVDTDEFKAQFIGKKGPFEGVDVVAGATYTSNGIIEALNKLFAAEETAPAADAEVLTATGVGFVNEDVTVIVTLNEDGTIATLAFDLSEQMEPVCNLVDTDEFKAQFIGKKGPFEGVDIVAGATYTSNGIIEALNKLFPAEEAAPAAEAAVLTAKGVGFVNEDVTVIVTLNEDGTIATLAFDLSEQMEPVCNLVDTDEFKAQFIGRKGPFEGVDVVAGATFTSNGIIEALNKLFPAEEAAPAAAEVLTSKGVGFVNEDVTVIVTLNEDGTIATLAFDLSEQMEPVCNLVDTDEFKAQFIGRKGPFEGVDIVAGATYTSNGIIEALNKLFPAE